MKTPDARAGVRPRDFMFPITLPCSLQTFYQELALRKQREGNFVSL